MKTLTSLILPCATLILVSMASFSQTYTTLKAGAWNNMTDIWSLDGSTPCLCSPGANSQGVDIIVNHDISVNQILDFMLGSTVQINNAVLSSSKKISIWDASFVIDTSLLFLHSGGEIEVKSNGRISQINGGKIKIIENDNDDITNAGIIDVCSNCCIEVSNSLDNRGALSGSGSVISSFELDNKGTWDPSIIWCSENVIGLSQELSDCITANANCSMLALPVELSKFKGTLMHDYVRLEWITVSEVDNDHFKVMRSSDGIKWFEIGQVKGMGNSTEKNCYSFEDNDLYFTTAYYKLVQVDYSGREYHSQVISVKNEPSLNEVILYPNPMTQTDNLTFGNLQPGEGKIYIVNTSGQVLIEEDFEGSS